MIADLVSLKVKPYPGEGYENIAPYLNVVFGACALASDVSMILCGSAVDQLHNLASYNVVKPFDVSQTDTKEVIEAINSSDQHEGHDDVEIHTKLPSTLMSRMNVTFATDGRSADVTFGDDVNSSSLDDQDIDMSLKNVVSSDVDKFKAEPLADVALQKAWSLAKVNKGYFFYKE